MNPVTHFFVGWSALERAQTNDRDRALVVLAGLAPDLDGLGIVIDFATRVLGMPATEYYQTLHRVYGHGLPAALVFAVLVSLFATKPARAAVYAFVAVHLHFICDILGSRGEGAEDIWGISYLAPFSDALYVDWSGQWPLVSWQNTVITAALVGWILWRALSTGYTPLRLVSKRGDDTLVATLRTRFRRLPPGN